MGRKVRRKLGPPLPRAARSLRTPRFTRGDVLATMDPDTWIGGKVRTSYYRLMWAAIAALLACARVTLCRASCLTLADYEAMCLTFTRKNDRSYPIILLPVAVEVMERYLVHRRKLGGTALFVGAKANRITHDVMTAAFIRLGKLYGLEGGKIHNRLIAFFDRCFIHERDRAAVAALRQGAGGNARSRPERAEAHAAALDIERLTKVLDRHHKLRGPAGKWLGGHGKAKIRKESRLFRPVRAVPAVSDLMRTDPVCARLLRMEWRREDMGQQRAAIIECDLPYLASLYERGLLSPRQIGYLVNVSGAHAVTLIKRLAHAHETCEQHAERLALERHWDGEVVRLFLMRPANETVSAFCERLSRAGYLFSRERLRFTLMRAEVLPAQIARRAHKAKPTKAESSRSRPPASKPSASKPPGNHLDRPRKLATAGTDVVGIKSKSQKNVDHGGGEMTQSNEFEGQTRPPNSTKRYQDA